MAELVQCDKKFQKMSCCYCCEYAYGVTRILCYMLCCKCNKKEQVVKEEFSLLALGLNGVGKSTLLSKICGEVEESIEPTKGFSLKDVSLPTAILHVKELGGSESIRRYWHNYYQNAEGLIFVFDGSASDEDTDTAKAELQGALTHPSLKDVPVLVLVSKVDSVSPDELSKFSEKLDIPKLCCCRSFIVDCYRLEDVSHLKILLEKFIGLIKRPAEREDEKGQQVKGRL